MSFVIALLAGLVFGVGLIVSGMVNPAKVQNFLDVTGTWDPSLAFVMLGAVAVTAPGFALARRRSHPLTTSRFHWPAARSVTWRLLAGATLFGVGWGIGGLCPGPAIVNLSGATISLSTFAITMLIGMGATRWLLRAVEPSTDA